MKKASQAYYSIINPNSFLFTLIIIFILVFGAASIIAYKHYKSALLYTIAENKSTASFLSTLMYEHQKATIGILESYAQHPLFIDAIQKKDFHHVLYHLKSLNEHYTEIDALFLTDQYGTLWANYPVDREGFGKNLAYRDWYKGVSKNWRSYISTVFRLIVLEKDPAVAVSVPVFDRKGKVIGILGSAQRVAFLATFIKENTLDPKKSITLLDQEGNIIYVNTVDYEKEITKYLHFSPIQEAIRNGKNILEIPDPVRGRKEDLLAFSSIRDMGWTVIVSEEKGAILRSETAHFIQIFAMAFLLFVCMIIAPLLLRRDYQYRETKELLTQEKKLRESEVRYKELFENMYVGIAVYEAIQDGNDFIFKDFNEGGEKIENVKRGDIIGKKVTEAFPGVAEFGLLDVFGRVWKTGNPEHHPVGLYKDQRISGWRENYIYKLPSGEIVAVYNDVTAQKQAEETLRESEERYRSLFDGVPISLYRTTPIGQIIDANPALVEMLGYPNRESLLAIYASDTYAYSEDRIKWQAFMDLEGIVRNYEKELQRRDGSIIWVEENARAVRDAEGRLLYYEGSFQDITNRKRAEEEKASLEEQLRQSQKMEAIGQLAGGISHDFNNLLTVISGNCQLFEAELTENEPQKEYLNEVIKAAERASGLTRQLLAFSRRQILEMSVLDLNGVLRNLDKMFHRVIGEDIDLVTLLDEDLGRVRADPGQIEQVMMNLAVNARDAMPSGGKLTIETTNVELDEEYARSHVSTIPGRYVMFSVSDTGVGMSQDIQERVFEPFFTTKEKGKGTGLGLSTAYGIVKQTGGNIGVYSEPGQGTAFKIYLPRVDEPLEGETKRAVVEKHPKGIETILLVEDDEKVRGVTIRILKKGGYRVLVASKGDEALQICKEHVGPIHLMLTDVVMPGMNGKELAGFLESLNPGMKVLYMSGYADNAILHHGILNKGMNYIQKPFTIEGLSRKVREVLDK